MAQEIKLEDYDDKFGEFFEEIKKNPQYNSDLIKKAYDLAYDAHKNQRRRSGEPYIIHPVAVAKFFLTSVWTTNVLSVRFFTMS